MNKFINMVNNFAYNSDIYVIFVIFSILIDVFIIAPKNIVLAIVLLLMQVPWSITKITMILEKNEYSR